MSLRQNNQNNKGGLTVVPGQRIKNTHNEIARPTGAGIAAVRRVAARDPLVSGRGNIGLIIDATGSRSSTWQQAQAVQANMFKSVSGIGQMSLRLIHYGGDQITRHDWEKDTNVVTAAMARVECQDGSTQIIESLDAFLADDNELKAGSIILVGDCYEEPGEAIEVRGKKLAEQKIRVFTFLEGEDETATCAFKRLSELTGGKFAKFGPGMPLRDLCEGVALLSVGGQRALSRLRNVAARQLLLK